MKHTKNIQRYSGTHEQLATEIGDLFYDSLANLLQLMAEKIAKDAAADSGRGRVRLAAELSGCAEHLNEASRHIAKAWEICAPFVAEDGACVLVKQRMMQENEGLGVNHAETHS